MAGLDNLGTNDRGDAVTLSATAQKLVELGGYLISEAQDNLNKSGSVATGDLDSSMKISDIDVSGKVIGLNIELLDRYRFIDLGVKGTEGGTGEYQFKTSKPSIGMQRAIKAWLRKRARRSTKYNPISKTERKDKKIARLRSKADSQDSLAWAVATNVKKNGIKPTKFFTKAVKATERKIKKELSEGFRVDIINSLKDGI